MAVSVRQTRVPTQGEKSTELVTLAFIIIRCTEVALLLLLFPARLRVLKFPFFFFFFFHFRAAKENFISLLCRKGGKKKERPRMKVCKRRLMVLFSFFSATAVPTQGRETGGKKFYGQMQETGSKNDEGTTREKGP